MVLTDEASPDASHAEKVKHYADGGSMLASRTKTHEPLACFDRMDNALPARVAAAPPDRGTIRTESWVQQYAKLPEILTSCTSPVDSMRCVASRWRRPLSNGPRPRIERTAGTKEDNVFSHQIEHRFNVAMGSCAMPKRNEIANGLFIRSHGATST